MVEPASFQEDEGRGFSRASERLQVGFLRFLLVKTAPVSSGAKPGVLLRFCDPCGACEGFSGRSFFKARREAVLEALRVDCATLRESESSTHALFYKASSMRATISDLEAARLLAELGYDADRGVVACLRELARRFNDGPFPHEIGLFLGYPPEDVRGFAERRVESLEASGSRWRVYGAPARSLALMAAHREAERQALAAAFRMEAKINSTAKNGRS